MEIYALFMLCGLFTTFLIPETKRKTLEELAGEVPGTPEYNVANLNKGSEEMSTASREREVALGEKNV